MWCEETRLSVNQNKKRVYTFHTKHKTGKVEAIKYELEVINIKNESSILAFSFSLDSNDARNKSVYRVMTVQNRAYSGNKFPIFSFCRFSQ